MNSGNGVLGRSLLPVNHDAKIKDTIAKEIPVLWLNIVSYKYHLVNRTVFTQSELRDVVPLVFTATIRIPSCKNLKSTCCQYCRLRIPRARVMCVALRRPVN